MVDKTLSDFGDLGVKFAPKPIKTKRKGKGGKGSDKFVKAGEPLNTLCFHYFKGVCIRFSADKKGCDSICLGWKCCKPKIKKRLKVSTTKTFATFLDLVMKDKRYKHLLPGIKKVGVKTQSGRRIRMTIGGSENEVQGTLR